MSPNTTSGGIRRTSALTRLQREYVTSCPHGLQYYDGYLSGDISSEAHVFPQRRQNHAARMVCANMERPRRGGRSGTHNTMFEATTLSELIEQSAARYADKPAFIWRPQFRAMRFSFQDMGTLARQAASLLEREGIRPGDRVILWGVNSPFWVATFFGCQLIGAVAVPLMAQNTPDFVQRVAQVTEAKLLMKSATMKSIPDGIRALNMETELQREDLPEDFHRADARPDGLAEIMFTSGTTGVPKGVPITHHNILSNVADVYLLDLVSPGEHLLAILPLAHSFEQVASLFTAMAMGLTVTQAASLTSLHILMVMQEDHPTMMVAVPEFLKVVFQQIERRAEEAGKARQLQTLLGLAQRLPMSMRRQLASPILRSFGGKLRIIISGGSPLDPETGRKWEALGIPVIQGYGASECSPIIAANRMKDRTWDTVGYPIASVQLHLADDGEIMVKGPNVISGYYKRPKETARRFRDGWYYTDDIGEYDEVGRLRIKGRKSYVIVTPSGENVYPEDIESELVREPGVRDAAVLGLEKRGRFEMHAVLLGQHGKLEAAPRDIIEHVNDRLQPHQRIQGVSVWDGDDFPRTVTRKVKKNLVLDWLKEQEQPVARRAAVAAGVVERTVANATGLPPEQITPDMKLESDLKLDSLGRVTLVGIIEEQLGVSLDEGRVTPTTTIADIKMMVEEHRQKEELYQFNPRPLTPGAIRRRWLLQKTLAWPLLSALGPLQVEGRENLQGLEGPLLIYPTHISPVDPAWVMKALPAHYQTRTAIAAASDIVYEAPFIRRFAGTLELIFNCYPFARETQVKSSLLYTGRLLDRGFSVMLFPEGHMSRTGKLQEIMPGSALIAVEMSVPVVPVGITGTEKIASPGVKGVVVPHRAPVKVTFGAPLRFPAHTSYPLAAEHIHAALEKLIPESYR